MKAVRMHGYGGVEQLFYEEADAPRISEANEVIVKLHAAAINHIDIWNRLGATGTPLRLPHILGADGAGTVAEVGADVTNVKAGDAVCLYPPTGCGQCEFCLTDRDYMCIRLYVLGERLEGTYAEYVKITAANCFPVPPGYSFQQAAAVPLVYVTLWRMVVTNAELKPGESMLIIGIGGGVASATLQIAKKLGARVIVTSSSDDKLAKAIELGADHGVNHHRDDVVSAVNRFTTNRGVDVVLDCVGGEMWRHSLTSLSRGGRLVTCGATAGGQPDDDIAMIVAKQLSIHGSTLGSRQEFRQLLSFLTAHRIKPIIDSVYPLRDAALAQQHVEMGRQFGKVVLQIAD